MQFSKTINAGDTVKLQLDSSPYSQDDGFSLEVKLSNGSVERNFSEHISALGATTFQLTVPHTETEALSPGVYHYAIVASDGAERYTLESGTVEVRSLSLSHERKVLNAICATLESRATTDQMSYTINGRSLARTSIPDLLSLKKYYEELVRQQEGPRTRMRTKIRRTWSVG